VVETAGCTARMLEKVELALAPPTDPGPDPGTRPEPPLEADPELPTG
jgi:hypothetical protein